ncbi:MAG: DUF1761 domain-containing protein [Bacteroidota bacterium]|jgi:hypothetical protein
MEFKINVVAVAIAAAAMWVLGALWYGIFSVQWMMYTGVTDEFAKAMTGMDMAYLYGGSLITYFILFYVQSHIHIAFQVKDLKGSMQAAVWSWLGFVATSMHVSNSYQGKSFGLTMIDGGYWLIGMVIGGVILVKMQKNEPAAK